MFSDMVSRGPFHHLSMTSGGRNTTPARTVQLSSDRGLPTMQTALAASAQTVANVTFICSSCMLQGYGALWNAAIPKRTARDTGQLRRCRPPSVTRAHMRLCTTAQTWLAPRKYHS